jgi:hypothetical protein
MNMLPGDVPPLLLPPVPHGAKRRRVQEDRREGLPLVGTNASARRGIDPISDELSYFMADITSAGTADTPAASMTGEYVLPKRTLSASALATSEAVRVARSGKNPAASGVTDMASVADSWVGYEDGFLVIEPMHAKMALGKKFGLWKETAESFLALLQPRITQLFQYSSTVSPASVTDLGATADGSPSCATIRLAEKTILQLPKPKGKIDRINLLSIVKLVRKALTTGNPELDAEVVEFEGWTG